MRKYSENFRIYTKEGIFSQKHDALSHKRFIFAMSILTIWAMRKPSQVEKVTKLVPRFLFYL